MSSLSPVAFENNDEEGTLSKGLVFFKNWRIFSLSVLLKKKPWKLHQSSMLEAACNFGHYNSVALQWLFPCKICAWTPCAQRPLFVGAFSRLHCNSRFINNSSLGSNDPNRLHTRIQCQALRPCYMMYSGQTLAICQTMWV